MAKITIDRDGKKETINMTNESIDKLFKLVEFVDLIKITKLSKKELATLKKLYFEFYFNRSFTCNIKIMRTALNYDEIKGYDYDIIKSNIKTQFAPKEVVLSDGYNDFLNGQEKQLLLLRNKVKDLAQKYNVNEELVWKAIRE